MTRHLEFSDNKVADQLEKFLKLAFISDQPGEVVNAIAAVRRLLASENRDPHWLVERLVERLPAAEPRPGLNVGRSSVLRCLDQRHLLSPKDQGFLEGIVRQLAPLSAAQQKWLNDIVAKLKNRSAA